MPYSPAARLAAIEIWGLASAPASRYSVRVDSGDVPGIARRDVVRFSIPQEALVGAPGSGGLSVCRS